MADAAAPAEQLLGHGAGTAGLQGQVQILVLHPPVKELGAIHLVTGPGQHRQNGLDEKRPGVGQRGQVHPPVSPEAVQHSFRNLSSRRHQKGYCDRRITGQISVQVGQKHKSQKSGLHRVHMIIPELPRQLLINRAGQVKDRQLPHLPDPLGGKLQIKPRAAAVPGQDQVHGKPL